MSTKTPDPLDVMVGAKIRIFRIHRKISQADLAEQIGVTFQQVQKYETGMNRVGASRLSRIAAVLGVSIGELFESPGDKLADAASPFRLLAEPGALRLLKSYAGMSDPSVRRAVIELAEATAHQESTTIPRPTLTKPDVSLDMHDRWLSAQNLMAKYEPESWQRAVVIFRDAVRENPTFSPCYSSLAQMNNIEHCVHAGLFRDLDKANATLELAKTAVRLDPADSRAHLCCGWSYALALREAEAELHMERACELNDSDPWILLSSALFYAFCGSIEQARLRAEQSLALSPLPSHLEWAYHGLIRFQCGDYAGALDACGQGQWVTKTLPAWRAAALFGLGQVAAAREEAQRFLNGIRLFWVGSSAPTDETVARWVLQSHPIGVRERWQVLRDGLRGAGLPVEGITPLSPSRIVPLTN
jgi:transcriptional regulator with XRE-family HTH domain